MNKKILIINTQGLRKEGITSTISECIGNMDLKGLDLHLAVVGKSDDEIVNFFSKLGCKIDILPERKKNTVRYFFQLIKLLRSNKFDMVHIHGSSSLIIIEVLAAKISKIKRIVSHCHNTRCSHEQLNKLLKPLLNYLVTDRFACGRDAGQWLYGEKNFKIIHNGKKLDSYRFNLDIRNMIRDKYNIGNQYVLGHVGNFNYQKNHEFIISIFSELVKKNPNWILMLVGEGENIDNIKSKVSDLGLSKKVIFTGSVNNVHEILQGFDVAILPSRFEGLPVVAIEYQACGLPCLFSDSITRECAPTKLVKFINLLDGENRWSTVINNTIIPNVADRKRISEEACEKLQESDYDITKVSKDLRKFYINC